MVLVRTASVLTNTHNLCFEQRYENIRVFIEIFQFLEVKFSIYLNRRVFVMAFSVGTSGRLWFVIVAKHRQRHFCFYFFYLADQNMLLLTK